MKALSQRNKTSGLHKLKRIERETSQFLTELWKNEHQNIFKRLGTIAFHNWAASYQTRTRSVLHLREESRE